MPTIAILVATSRTATEIIKQTLLPSIPATEPTVINAVVRSDEKLRTLHPQSILQNRNLHVFQYDDKDPSALSPALKDVDTVYITTGGTEFDKPTAVIHDAVANVTSCLISLRLSSTDAWKKPKIILLSSGGHNPIFQAESRFARFMHWLMSGTNTHFFDLEISEQLLVSFAQSGCYDYVLFQPGLMVTAEPSGDWELKDCAYADWIGYADMAASMIHLAETDEWDAKIAAPTVATVPNPGLKGLKTQFEAGGWALKTFVLLPLLKVVVYGGIGFGIGWWVKERAARR